MRTQMQEFSKASLRNDKQQIEARFLDLASIGSKDLQICEPIIDELLPLTLDAEKRMISLGEAVWLKIAAELLRSQFDSLTIFKFRYAMLGPIIDPEDEIQATAAEEELVLPEEFFRTLDMLIGNVAKEKEDVLLQFTRNGAIGIKVGPDESRMLKSANLTFSIHELVIKIFDDDGLSLTKMELKRLTKAESALVEVVRDSTIREFQVTKANNEELHQWDLIIHKEGLATRRELHELMHTSFNSCGTFQIITNNRSKAHYKQTQRLRF